MSNRILRLTHIFLAGLLGVALISCDNTTTVTESAPGTSINVVPVPKELTNAAGTLVLSDESSLFTSDDDVAPLLEVMRSEIKQLTGKDIGIAPADDRTADVVFRLEDDMPVEEHRISIEDKVSVSGGSYAALAQARSTLLQLIIEDGDQLAFPRVTIVDRPDAEYRGLLIDLARNWHRIESIKQLIDLASFYKTNYIQLHFTDYQSYTLPSKAYPKLPTPDRHYTVEQLKDLDRYARERGIQIIPELEMPGHAKSMTDAYPDLFGIDAIAENPWIIHMGKEEVYDALATLLEELVEIFPDAPYIHIGGDEAIFNHVMEDPDVQEYVRKHELGDDVHELYRHFLVRINDIVRGLGKDMAVWEGFAREGQVPIPKNILVFEFETNRYLPQHLIEDGYTVVNTSWKPIYVVNQKKWEPKTIYEWNMWRWENWWPAAPSIEPIQLEETPQIIGAQMCAWEQAEEVEFPSLRKRLPVMNERIWNTHNNPGLEDFLNRLDATDARLSRLTRDTRQDSLLVGHNWVAPD